MPHCTQETSNRTLHGLEVKHTSMDSRLVMLPFQLQQQTTVS